MAFNTKALDKRIAGVQYQGQIVFSDPLVSWQFCNYGATKYKTLHKRPVQQEFPNTECFLKPDTPKPAGAYISQGGGFYGLMVFTNMYKW